MPAEEALFYPVPNFRFEVEISDVGFVSFQEVTGIENEVQALDYRAGDSPNCSVLKIPGMHASTNIVFKRGIYKEDNKLSEWLQAVKEHKNGPEHEAQRKTIIVNLRSDNDEIVRTWTFTDVLPLKVTGTSLNAQNNELSIESLEFT